MDATLSQILAELFRLTRENDALRAELFRLTRENDGLLARFKESEAALNPVAPPSPNPAAPPTPSAAERRDARGVGA